MSTADTVGVLGAAEIMHVHPKTVEDLIRAGAIPAAKVGRAWVMLRRDVLGYVEMQIAEQTSKRLVAQRKRSITTEPQPGPTL